MVGGNSMKYIENLEQEIKELEKELILYKTKLQVDNPRVAELAREKQRLEAKVKELEEELKTAYDLGQVIDTENQKNKEIVQRLNELIRYKEQWIIINSYRISEHQKQLVKNEIKELKEILGDKLPQSGGKIMIPKEK